ncbi:MAG TPA: hypothetical protein VEI97_16015 [bacterium]|nr:hypothetical protein [bacterium]
MPDTRMQIMFFSLLTSAIGLGLGFYGYMSHHEAAMMVGFMDLQVISIAQLRVATSTPIV